MILAVIIILLPVVLLAIIFLPVWLPRLFDKERG